MLAPSSVADENERLSALDGYTILDTSPEEAFDDVVRLASLICGTPIALISLVDATRQWFKARVGLNLVETAREISFCGHAIAQENVFIVPDTHTDLRFANNPLVVSEPGIRFYAGAPLTTPSGLKLGTLCVMDRRPRTLTSEQIAALRSLARQVIAQLELRRTLAERAAAHIQDSERHELERMKKDFITTVNHELRTPLTSLRGSLSLLASGVMGELPEGAKSMVTVAERNSIRLIALVSDILDFDKLQNGRMEMDVRPCSLHRVLQRAIEEAGPLAVQEGVEVVLSGANVRVMGDEDRLVQVVVNLLSNAIKYSHRGGAVTVIVEEMRGWAEVRLVDRGRGIAAEVQARLFQKFQRGDSSDARTQPGTGMGLSICKAIVEQHGGAIGVESTEGEGSTFWFRIYSVKEFGDREGVSAKDS